MAVFATEFSMMRLLWDDFFVPWKQPEKIDTVKIRADFKDYFNESGDLRICVRWRPPKVDLRDEFFKLRKSKF